MKNIIGITLIGALIFTVGFYGLKSTEINECLTWQQQATQYTGFYLADWQEQQCAHYKITIQNNEPITPGYSARIQQN